MTAVAWRELGPEDAAAIVALEERVFPEEPWTAAMVAEELAAPGRLYLGLDADGSLVAYGGITLFEDSDLMTIGVDPDRRGEGLGLALLQELLARAREAAVARMFLEVRESNAAAISLYEREGFRRVGRIRRYYRHPVEDAVTMRLVLTKPTIVGD